MRKQILLLLSLFISIASFSQSLKRVKRFGKNKGHLKMFYYEPANIDKTKAQPMVVVLHGCLQCASTVAAQTGWNKLADEHGFYVLYPQQRFFNNPEKCFKWYKRKHTNKNRGENYSIKKMVDYMQSHNKIDSSKVFITGLSAGAAMSVIMMADYPETFNAGAIFAGGAYKSGNGYVSAMMALLGWRVKSAEKWGNIVRKQNPGFNGNYPRMIIYQGNSDWVVNKRNGTELLKQWSNLHHIGIQPTETINQYVNVKDIQRNAYASATNKEAILFYKVNKLSHALLVDPGKCKYQGGKRGFFSKDKNYNSTLFTAYDFGLIKRPSINGPQKIKKEEKNVQFTITPESSTSTLLWSYPSDCKVIKNDNSNTLILDWGNNPGNINVSELDSQNCIKQYHTLSIQIE